MNKFIRVTPAQYHMDGNYKKSNSYVLIAVDNISIVYNPDPKNKVEYYTICLKGMAKDTIKTFDDVTNLLLGIK